MKKLIKVISFAAAMIFMAAGCNNNPETDDSGSQTIEPSGEVSEIDGTYSYGNQTMVFNKGTMDMYQKNSTSKSARAASDLGTKQSVYSFTVDSTNKTMTMQLTGLFWGTDETAMNYDAYVQKAKAQYTDAKTKLSDTLNNEDIKACLSTLSTVFNIIQTTSGSSTDYINDCVYPLIKDKLGAYLDNEEKIFDSYLNKKYEAKLVFGYELTDNSLKLTQKFQGDLTDASADFASADGSVKLNDYENLIPFYISSGKISYVGVPVISDASMTVDLIPFIDPTSDEEISALANSVMGYIYEKKLMNISSDTATVLKLVNEVKNNQTTTIESWIDETLNSITFKADLTVDTATPKVTVKASADFAPVYTDEKIASDTSYDLSYKALLSAEWSKAE